MSEQLYRIRPIEWKQGRISISSSCGRFAIYITEDGKHQLTDSKGHKYRVGIFPSKDAACEEAFAIKHRELMKHLEPVPNPAIDRSSESV